MAEHSQSVLTGKPHLNRGLFADYYLEEIVPTLAEWDAVFKHAKPAFEAIKALRAKISPSSLDESQLEELWVKPILDILGHHYSVQVKIRYRERGHRKPDYVLLKTADDVHALTNAIYTPEQISHALAVADAKKWGVNLDQSAPNERNPSQQIDEYLRYSELPWGILTDGRYWRLYHHDSSMHNAYYAVDLESLLDGDIDKFRYFYAFFRQAAITSGWLEKVRLGSEDFAEKLTDALENEVYEALELVAQGFLDYRRNKLTPTPETLREIYEQSLVMLYRLLFVLFAESREILPLYENAEYDKRSLKAIKDSVKFQIDHKKVLSADSSEVYTRLSELFFAIDAGDPQLGLPAYNGRLFADADHPFLTDKRVGDFYLIPALDKLARVNVQKGKHTERAFVDYRDLAVRHLGSIYEKLLEYDLDIATEPLTVKEDKYVAAKTGDVVRKQPGQVYLRTGNNERKVTGSYYTPDYIVRFIVEKTIEPLLNEITLRHAHLDDEGHWQVHDSAALIRDVMALNILDPATGSGHFVVDATAYIAEKLRDLALHPADLGSEDELIYWKRQVASACIYAVDINPLAVELAKLSMWLTTLAKGKPLSFLDHHIRVGNSLVGTSLSDISDDLEAEKRRKARERDINKAEKIGQIPLFSDDHFADGVRFAVAQMAEIELTHADSVGEVKQQEALYRQLVERLSQWRQAADVWTARSFGLPLKQLHWEEVKKLTTGRRAVPEIARIVGQAEQMAAEYRFFHWELAFPEIFFDVDGKPKADAGFDAVIGNPPYVRYQNFSLVLKNYLAANFKSYSGSADLFLYFFEQGLSFLKPDSRLGFITSGTYMNSNSAKSFREYINDNAAIEWIANFGTNQPFKGAEMVYPTIAILRNGLPKETFRNLFIEDSVPVSQLSERLNHGTWVDSLTNVTSMEEWRFQSVDRTQLFRKINLSKLTLGERVNGKIYYGVLTGLTEVFVIDAIQRQNLIAQHSSSAAIIRPVLRGQDARPWYQIEAEQYLICTRQGIDIDSYPAVKQYLETYRIKLEPKPSDWNVKLRGKWLGRSEGTFAWYEWTSPVAYFDEFDKPKIIWSDISKLPRFSLDAEGRFYNNTVYGIGEASYSLLAILQSRVAWYCLSQLATPLRLRAGLWQYRLFKQYVERLPIPVLTVQQESDLAAIAEETTALSRQRYQAHESFREILSADFGKGQAIDSGVRLYQWWTLADDKALSGELKKLFKTEIPLNKRAEWRAFLADQKAAHQRLTDQIIGLEIRLNDIVYDAFDLTPDERRLIEESTKYAYGEV